MARQLRARGERVALVALIDASPSNAGYESIPWWRPDYPVRFAVNVSYWLRDFAELPGEERRRFFTRKKRSLLQKVSKHLRRQARPDDVNLEEYIDLSHFPDHELKFWQIHLRAMARHIEQPYDGSVTLIRTRGQPIWCSLAYDFCWTRLVRGRVAVKLIPGSHENIFIEPHVRFLAQQLDASLDECPSEAQPTLHEPAHA
jgi:thioesterase domain-containing protein